MDRPLRACLIHVHEPLRAAFAALGCETLLLMPGPGVLHLPAELERHGFAPDLVFQQELLGPRTLLAGLEELPAARVFWAVDPHLNAFWHAPYARLFDLVFSTQKRWMLDLALLGAEHLRHLPWYAPIGPCPPFAERTREAGFVGRLGPTRPVRAWLVELMRALLGEDASRFEARDDLDFSAMLDFYRATRLIPNESIAGEINFRLFEAAGCGCVVLAQDLGQEQAELYEPGREMLVCADALELAEAVRMLAARPRLAEALGRAAHARSQAEHRPLDRARTILAEALAAPRLGAKTHSARRWLSLALAGLYEAGRLDSGGEGLAADLAALPEQDGPVLAARLRLAHALNRTAEAETLLLTARDNSALPAVENLPALLACSMSALRLGQEDPDALALARGFARKAGVALPKTDGPATLLLAWADTLAAAGRAARGGFPFDAHRHLPGSAAECLYWAAALSPGDTTALARIEAHLAGVVGAEALRLGVLSDLSLRRPEDWRVGLSTGLCDLKVFRPEAGLSEIALAAALAERRSESPAFAAALAQADPSGRIRRALAP